MSPLRSARRLSSVTSHFLYGQRGALSNLAGTSLRLTDATALLASTNHSAQATGPQVTHCLPPRGFAAGSTTSCRQISSNSPGPGSRPPASSQSQSAGADTSSSDSDSEHADPNDPEALDAEGNAQLFNQPAIVETEKDELLQKIQSASKKHQRHMLQQFLTHSEMSGSSTLGSEEETNAAIEAAKDNYSLKLVDVNSTNKGSPKGGIQSFSAMVVVGNQEGLLGHGTGKAAELIAAIRKASMRALNNLTFVPRYERFTILHPVDTKYGKCKLRMYPLASGSGIRANALLGDIASLAGINSIGIKIHGSRNARNSVKALFQAFEELTTIEKQAQEKGMAAVEVILGSRPKPKQRFKYSSRLTK